MREDSTAIGVASVGAAELVVDGEGATSVKGWFEPPAAVEMVVMREFRDAMAMSVGAKDS